MLIRNEAPDCEVPVREEGGYLATGHKPEQGPNPSKTLEILLGNNGLESEEKNLVYSMFLLQDSNKNKYFKFTSYISCYRTRLLIETRPHELHKFVHHTTRLAHVIVGQDHSREANTGWSHGTKNHIICFLLAYWSRQATEPSRELKG